MDNLTGSMKDVAFATSPREFDLSYSTTLEEIMEKLNARKASFWYFSRRQSIRAWISSGWRLPV